MSSHSDNQSKLSQFFAEEYQNLLSFARRYWHGDQEMDAEDVVQEVALNLYKRVDFNRPVENLLAYAYRSLKNRIIDRQRKRKDVQLEDFEDEENGENYLLNHFAEEDIHWDEETDSEEEIQEMLALIDRLKPKYADVILKTELEGYSFEELSAETGIPLGTLLSRKHRGMAMLQKLMKEKQNENY